MTDDDDSGFNWKAMEDASHLCVTVFCNSRTDGHRRFVMPVDELIERSGLPRDVFDDAMVLAAERDWLLRRLEFVELKAAGIHVAKASLDRG